MPTIPTGRSPRSPIGRPGAAPTHVWAFAYVGGRLVSITDPSGQVTQFVVNDHRHLTQVTFSDGLSRRFYYDARGLMTQQVGTDGAVNSYTYDSHGGIQSETYPQRAVYNPDTGLVELAQEVIAFTPSKTAYPFINDGPVGDPDNPAPPAPLSAGLVDSMVDGSGEVHSGHTNKWGYWLDQTDRIGRTTTYERDGRNNITRVTLDDGDCIEYTYDGNEQRADQDADRGGPVRAARRPARRRD